MIYAAVFSVPCEGVWLLSDMGACSSTSFSFTGWLEKGLS